MELHLKLRAFVLSILFVLGATSIEPASATETNLRHRSLTLEDFQCRLYRQDTLLIDPDATISSLSEEEGQTWLCMDDADGIYYTFDNLPAGFFSNPEFISGSSVVTFQNVYVSRLAGSHERSVIRWNASSKYIHSQEGFLSDDVANANGERNVLIVRVVDKNKAAPTSTVNELSADWFSSDGVNAANQFKDCSGGQMTLHPAVGDGINNGVMEVLLDAPVKDLPSSSVENMVTDKLAEQFVKFDTNTTNIHHIVYVLPETIDFIEGAASYAYVNGKISVFHDTFASKLHAQMQTISHNLGRGHSGEGSDVYGDGTGVMGAGSFADDGPRMCFNAHKNWYYGWYNTVEIDPTKESWEGMLVGVNDFASGEVNDESESDFVVVVRFKEKLHDNTYYYLGYNRKEGMTSEVTEYADMVTLHVADGTSGSQQSKLIGGYVAGDEHIIPEYDGSYPLVIKVCELKSWTPDYARILVFVNDGSKTLSCDTKRTNDEPSPVEPSPVEPSPVEPSPVEPSPVEPSPVEPISSTLPSLSPSSSPSTAPSNDPSLTPSVIPSVSVVPPEPVLVSTTSVGTVSNNKKLKRAMFDVTAKENVVVNSLKMKLNPSFTKPGKKYTFALWTKEGSYAGFETNLAGWQAVALESLTWIVAPQPGELADIVFKDGSLSIAQGETRAFYIVFQKPLLMQIGTDLNKVCSEENNLIDIFEGKAAKTVTKVFPEPYIWQGQVEVTAVNSS